MKIGLVLSGGMAKGAYQIGSLKAIQEFIPNSEIKYISGASIGVLNGYAYAMNKLNTAEEMWESICIDNVYFYIGQILRGSILQQNIQNLFDEKDSFSSIFYASLLNIRNRNVVYKNLSSVSPEKIPLYLKASISMPLYNHPVSIEENLFFDGAMVDNIPIFPLLKHNVDYILCLYFDDICYKFENTYFDNKIIKITFPSKNILRQSVRLEKTEIEEMICTGYEKTYEKLKSIIRNDYKDVDYIYNYIERHNQNMPYSLRVTGDMLVTNLNKITQKLTKRKIIL